MTWRCPPSTLLKRAAYGGKKGSRAWRRLLDYRLGELTSDGLEFRFEPAARTVILLDSRFAK